jgi:acetyl esterase/lipase
MRLIILMLSMGLAALACRRGLLSNKPTPAILADTFFFGHAWVDSNTNGLLDSHDAPLEGARFTAEQFGALTGKDGTATIVIPGGWDRPVTAKMAAPEGSGYTLIEPSQVELDPDGPTSADFLFATPQPAASVPALPDAQGGAPLSGGTPALDAPGSVHRNLVYCRPTPGVELKLDVYQPVSLNGPSPVVVYVHGGGWTSGSKDDQIGEIFANALGQRGYLTVAINYRLAPQYQFPAQIHDAKCAVRYLRAHANTYHLDPQRIAMLGASAGGHLAALVGTSDETAGFDVGEYTDQSSRVQAVVDLFGPSDLVSLMEETYRGYGERVFGVNTMDPEKIAPYSPVTYITTDDPPFLIMHGEKDDLVPIEQSEILYDRLNAAGIPAQFVRVKNAGHAFRPVGGEVSPGPLKLVQIMSEFLDRYLK